MALDYFQGLAGVAAMEMSDTGSCPSVHQRIHVIIMNAHLPDLLESFFFFFLIEHAPVEGSGLSKGVLYEKSTLLVSNQSGHFKSPNAFLISF